MLFKFTILTSWIISRLAPLCTNRQQAKFNFLSDELIIRFHSFSWYINLKRHILKFTVPTSRWKFPWFSFFTKTSKDFSKIGNQKKNETNRCVQIELFTSQDTSSIFNPYLQRVGWMKICGNKNLSSIRAQDQTSLKPSQ